jgi:hypothetical protein
MAARPSISINGHQSWGSKARSRIDSTLIVERLQRVALGHEEATQTELMAARLLLNRTLPEIKPIEVKTESGKSAKTITNDDLLNIIEGQAKRIGNE